MAPTDLKTMKPRETMKPLWKTIETNQKPWKNHETTLKNQSNPPPLIQKRDCHQRGPNRPQLIQKLHVINTGSQPTSIDPKTSRH